MQKVINETTHHWVYYVNPRNKKIHIKACDQCGAIKTGAVTNMLCEGYHTSNLISNQGWQQLS